MTCDRWISRRGCALYFTIAGLLVALGAASNADAQQDDVAASQPKQADLRALLADDHHLAGADLQLLILPQQARGPQRIQLTLGDQPVELSLSPRSVRAAGFNVSLRSADGRLLPQRVQPSCTFRGSLTGNPDSRVAATIRHGELRALIVHDGEYWAVQPVPDDLLPVNPGLHMVFRRSDIIPGDWACGATSLEDHGGIIDTARSARGAAVTACIAVAELAIDADAEFYQLNNSSVDDTTADIESIINAVNLIYGFQVGIEHLITDLIVHEDPNADPFTNSDSGALLGQFRDFRFAQPYDNPFDVAHLFTGRDLDSSIIGVAWLNAICNPNIQYGLSESLFSDNFILRVILTAHELGHNWSGRHCNPDPDCGIMCAAVASCSGTIDAFGATASTDIVAFRNVVPCLGDGSESFGAAGKLLAMDGDANDTFGVAVDIDGAIAIAGAYQDDEFDTNAGAAYIYEFDGQAWVEQAKLMPNPEDFAPNDRFGVSVAIQNTDEHVRAVVGAYLDTGVAGNSGSVYVFERVEGKWTQMQKLVKPSKMVGDLFGLSLDMSGEFIIVGAPLDNTKGSDAGAAFIFRDNGIEYEFMQKLTAGPAFGDSQDQFGYAVAVNSDPELGDVAVVGSPFDDQQAPNGGSAWFYTRDPKSDTWVSSTSWFSQESGAQFGSAVDIDGPYVVVGAWLSNLVDANAGRASIFEYSPKFDTWAFVLTIQEPLLTAGANFGSSVAIEDDLIAIGAYLDDVDNTDDGAVYTYRFDGTQVIPLGRLVPDDLGDGDQLGLSVAISGDLVMAGAWMHEDTQPGQGASYIFLAPPDPRDCDGSGLPDQCEIESGILPDCNDNGIPDACDITDGASPDDDMNGIPDECDSDCNGNGITDSTEIADGSVPDCNDNGYPDSCDIDPADPDGDGEVSTDLNMDGIPDECAPDCNGNGIPDSIDIADMTSFDCNANGIPDECDRQDFSASSAMLGPVGPSDPQQFTLNASTVAPPWAVSDVLITVFANADLDLATEYIRVVLDGNTEAELFRSGAYECPGDDGLAPDVDTVVIPADVWNRAIRRDSEAILDFETSGSVSVSQCSSGSWLQVNVDYAAGDCNLNGILDACEIADGLAADCNANGVPDACELALFDCNSNGVLDDCEFDPADIDDNGVVDIFDLLDLLAAWGPCPGCPEDVVSNDAVDVFDLLELLAAWTTCP